MTSAPHQAILASLGLGLALVCTNTLAQDPDRVERPEIYELNLELGLEHSDNRARTSPRGSSETALVPRAALDLSRSGRRLTLRVAGETEQRLSLDGPFGNDFQANLAARLNWHLVEESLDWIVENVASGAPIELGGQNTLENRQQTNVFSTGPRWSLQPQAAWSGLVDARYVHSYAEDSDAFNSDRLAVAARVVRRLGRHQQLSAGLEATEVRYQDNDFSTADHQRYDLVGRYRSTLANLELDLAAGRTRIELDNGQRLDDALLRFRLIWRLNDAHHLLARIDHELSDSVRQLSADIEQLDLPIPTNDRLRIGNEFYVLDHRSLGWFYRWGTLAGSVSASSRDYRFELDPLLDMEEHSLSLGLTWRLAPTLSLDGGLGLDRRRFRIGNQRDTDGRASLFVVRRFNPRWSGRIGALRYQRDSNVLGGDSRENILAFYLTYHAGR